jgi:predicted dehydrogenase
VAAEASAAVTMVEMTHRFYPPVVQARALARSGRLGQIVAVSERIVQPVREGELPPWMYDLAQAGGGVATTNGVHMLDRIAWVSGQPLRLHHGLLGHTQRLGDVEDTAALLLSLADGTPVSLLASWPRGDGKTDDELTLYGTEGILRIWAWRGWAFEPASGPAEVHTCYPAEADHAARARVGMTGALTEFVAAIAEERPANPAFREILEVQRLLDRLYRSSGIA